MNMGLLLAALIAVESGGNDKKIGDHGEAAGCLQIHMAVIWDVNGYYDMNFKDKDRLNRNKSLQLATLYLAVWSNNTYQGCARVWNGGPKGASKPGTLPHWEKVKKELRKLGVHDKELE